MDPDQLEKLEDKMRSEEKSLLDDANKNREEAKRLRSENERMIQTTGIAIQADRNDALKHPDKAAGFEEAATTKQAQLDQLVNTNEQKAKLLDSEADKLEAKAVADHREAEKLKDKKQQRQAIIIAQNLADQNNQ